MQVNKVLNNLNFSLSLEEKKILKKRLKDFKEVLNSEIKKKKVKAEIFVGGSFGKNTMIKDEKFEVDIFIRFDKKQEDLPGKLSVIIKGVEKMTGVSGEKIHGSRDYFKFNFGNMIFELVPVLKIKKVKEARNVTDLSYFHVNYVKKNLTGKMEREIAFAKKFCKAQGVYGAESYIQGFSGYALECLIIYYKNFEKMLRELVKVSPTEKKVIDIKKFFKKGEALVAINENKTASPIVLIDPTWKERNILASLSLKTFEKFQKAGQEFLKKPSEKFFSLEKFNVDKFRKKNGEFAHLILKTDRQEGDIGATKMKKFSRYLENEIVKYFLIIDKEFVYSGGQSSDFFIIVKTRSEILKKGPFVSDKKNSVRFRKKNKVVFEKEGRLFAKIKINFSLNEFLMRIAKKDFSEMGITDFFIAKN